MGKRMGLVLGITGCFIFISPGLSFSQEATAEIQAAPETEAELQRQWLWGEVVSVDTADKTLVVKYLDYEADEEKDIIITTDESTIYENVNSLPEVKINDALSIDYTVSTDSKNIAKIISVEKAESEPASQEEITPEDLSGAPGKESGPSEE